jgi:hypothetical protein
MNMAATTTTLPTRETATEEEQRQLQREKNRSGIELLESWAHASEEEIAEQQETWEFLKRALDEDRPSYRKFFP